MFVVTWRSWHTHSIFDDTMLLSMKGDEDLNAVCVEMVPFQGHLCFL